MRVEPRRRLVEEEKVGVADEREAEVEPAALAPGERADSRIALLLEPDQLDDLVDRPRLLVIPAEEREALADGQRRVHRRGLEDDADLLAPPPIGSGRVRAEHGHRAGVALAVALEDLDGRGLARAVWAEEAEDLARGDLEADAADRFDLAVGFAQIETATAVDISGRYD